MLLHYPYLRFAVPSNIERRDASAGLQSDTAKLGRVSKIALCVGTLSNSLSIRLLMNLRGC